MTGPDTLTGTIPVGPMLSMYDPIHIGGDEFGQPVAIRLIYRNLLAAGEPGGGKSGLLNTLAAHVALSVSSRMVLFDGKQVELGMWDDIADEFVGPDLTHAIITLLRLQKVMDNRYSWLRAQRRRKIEPGDGLSVITSIFDEIALFATVLGHRAGTEAVRVPAPGPGGPRPRRRHARHRRHPAAIAWTSSPRACATCSATAPRSAAPPPAAPTSSSATAGPKPDSPPPTSAPSTRAKASSSPKAAAPSGSRSPT